MIYVLHCTLASMPVPILPAEAAELLDLPWPVNPYHLAAVVSTDDLGAAYAITQASETPRIPGLLVAHDLDRSTRPGDILITDSGGCFLVPEQGDVFPYLDRICHLASRGRLFGGIHDISSYRITSKNF